MLSRSGRICAGSERVKETIDDLYVVLNTLLDLVKVKGDGVDMACCELDKVIDRVGRAHKEEVERVKDAADAFCELLEETWESLGDSYEVSKKMRGEYKWACEAVGRKALRDY
jgi:hypothetical protein